MSLITVMVCKPKEPMNITAVSMSYNPCHEVTNYIEVSSSIGLFIMKTKIKHL